MALFLVHLITSPNINRFSKFFHCQNQETFCNETITIDRTTPQVCRYTTLWNVRPCTQAGDSTDQRWLSLACGPQTARTQIRSSMLFGIFFNRWSINVDDWRQSTSWSRRSSLSKANCRSVWIIAPLVSGIAGLDASSSKVDTFNIWCKNCKTCF